MTVLLRSPWPLTLVALLAHGLIAAALPLFDDEAYYRLWASAPAFGNYDHPPMIAWMIFVGEALLGPTSLGSRAVSVLAFALVTPMVWRMAVLAGGHEAARAGAGLWAAVFWNLSWLVMALGSFATPDAPTVLFWALTLWALTEALERTPQLAPGWWALAGLGFGLGLQSKLIGLFLGVGIILWLFTTREGRTHLKRPGPWLAAAIAMTAIAPFIWWNLQNDLAGLELQFSRIRSGTWNVAGLAEYLGTMVLVFGPFASWFALRGLGRMRQGRTLWLATLAPLALYMGWHSLQHHVAANWLVPLHVPLAVLAGIGASSMAPRWPRLGATVALIPGLAILAVLLAPPAPLVPGNNPPNQMRGWPMTDATIRAVAAANGAQWIATSDYALTAQMWYRLGQDTPVWSTTEPRRYLFRAPMPPELCAVPALLVEYADRDSLATQLFDDLGPSSIVMRDAGGVELMDYRLTPVRGLRDCPAATNAGL